MSKPTDTHELIESYRDAIRQRRYCCFPECPSGAEWEMVDEGGEDSRTEVCAAHVGPMLSVGQVTTVSLIGYSDDRPQALSHRHLADTKGREEVTDYQPADTGTHVCPGSGQPAARRLTPHYAWNNKERGTCPVCGVPFAVTKAGTVYRHYRYGVGL